MINHDIQNNKKLMYKYSVFAFWFGFSFILNGYASGVAGVSWGSVVFIFMILFSIIHLYKEKIHIHFLTLLLVVSFILISLIDMIYLQVSFRIFLFGVLKLLVWALMCTWAVPAYFNYDQILKWLLRISIILIIYIIFQIIAFYVMSIYLPNIFSFAFLKPYVDDVNYVNLSSGTILRPGSLLSESSFYGNFVLCTLVMFLEKNIYNLKDKNIFLVIFLSIGIVLSTSTSAIIMLAFVWFIYVRKLRNKTKVGILFIVIMIVLIMYLTGMFEMFIKSDNNFAFSFNYAFNKFTYLNSSARVGKSYNYLNLLSNSTKVIGVGVGNSINYLKHMTGYSSIYINSITSIIIETGYLGLIMFSIFIFSLYYKAWRKKNTLAFVLLTIYFVKGFASSIYFSTYGILFISIIYYQLMYQKSFMNERTMKIKC